MSAAEKKRAQRARRPDVARVDAAIVRALVAQLDRLPPAVVRTVSAAAAADLAAGTAYEAAEIADAVRARLKARADGEAPAA